jgi:hypothetical protein
MLAERARVRALAANRRGDFDEARRIVRETIETLRALAPGDPGVGTVIAQLERDEAEFGEAMTAMALKQRHFASSSLSASRAVDGTARRRPRGTT